jgi:hypothetical protein
MIDFSYREIMCSNGYKLYVMASNMVLNNLLVPLVYYLLKKYFYALLYICIGHACGYDMYIYFNHILTYQYTCIVDIHTTPDGLV